MSEHHPASRLSKKFSAIRHFRPVCTELLLLYPLFDRKTYMHFRGQSLSVSNFLPVRTMQTLIVRCFSALQGI